MRWAITFLALLAVALAPRPAQAAIPLCPPLLERILCANLPTLPGTSVTVNTGTVGNAQHRDKLGVDMTVQIDVTAANTGMWNSFGTIPLRLFRWPDDRTDQWHCYDNSTKTGDCIATNPNPAYASAPDCISSPVSGCAVCLATFNANSGAPGGFDSFMGEIVAQGAKVNLSANYGCNYDGSASGDPTEAAGWAAYCVTTYSTACGSMTIGTEIYNCNGDPTRLCDDLHGTCTKNSSGQCTTEGSDTGDPTTYGAEYATWQNDIHTATSNGMSVCVLGAPQKSAASWDTPVKAALTVTPDCQEIECYTQNVFGDGTDNYALNHAANDCDDSTITTGPTSASLTGISAAKYPGVPIYMDQVALVPAAPGPQSLSIVNALYYGQMEMQAQLDSQVSGVTYHTGEGATCHVQAPGPGVYAWTNFGSADAWSIQKVGICANYETPINAAMANAYSMQVVSNSIHNGEHMLGVTVGGSQPILAWAATNGSGYTVFLENLSFANNAPINLFVTGKISGTGGTTLTYDRAQYDSVGTCSGGGFGPGFGGGTCWAQFPPISGTFGAWSGSIPLVLPPWSETSVIVN